MREGYGNGGLRADNGFAGAVSSVAEHVRSLVRLEAELAAVDVGAKLKRMSGALGLLAGAGVVAFLGLGVSVAAIAALIALALPWWAALLIVAGALFLTAGILVLLGRSALRRAAPPLPTIAVEEARSTLDELARAS